MYFMWGIDAYPGIDNEGSYPVTAIALRGTWVCEIPFDDLEAACRRVPGLQNRILHLMSHRIIDYQSHLDELRWANPAQHRLVRRCSCTITRSSTTKTYSETTP
jgi:CRP/FNR family transcriptional regulator, anaerobic regulatory protein